MIKDIIKIREELIDYEEVELPFEFEKGCHIKYITKKDEDESFYTGGLFLYFGNDCIVLENNNRKWSVPLYKRNKDGSICYKSRFFIKDKEEQDCEKDKKELNEIIEYQQSIIQTMTEKIKELEIIKHTLINEKREYEELLQQNRYNFQNVCIESKEKDEKIIKYEDIIHKLTNSHSMFN